MTIWKAFSILLILTIGCDLAWAGPPGEPAMVSVKAPPRATELPAALRPALYRVLTKNAGPVYNFSDDGCVHLTEQMLAACFDSYGAHFRSAGATPLALHLSAYGREGQLAAVASVQPAIEANRVSYVHDNLTEWWRVLPVGLEQGFTVTKRPDGRGELTLALAANDKATRYDGALGWGKLRYGKLVVTDANGNVVPAALRSEGDRILITINDTHAIYPIVVDPLVWLEQKAVASDGALFGDFGWSVAVSGATALIGAYGTEGNQGAVYVFTRSNGTWSEVQKLTASDGTYNDQFGWSLALSGTTALIGAPFNDSGQGAAYVFTESDGTWSEVQELTANDGAAGNNFGDSVALDGTTAFVGSPFAAIGDNAAQGAVYVFTDSNDTWTQSQKLTADDGTSGDQFGHDVAADGTTVLVGAPIAGDQYQGAAYMFTESNDTWTQAQKLIASDGTMGAHFGNSVALSNTTALIGTPSASAEVSDQGAAYVFITSNGAWTQAQKLTADDGAASDNFGASVALSNTTALVGANLATVNGNSRQGAAYVFTENNGTWQQKRKLMASDGAGGDDFGWSVAISGLTAVIGSPYANVDGNHHQGAAYFYSGADLGLAVSAPGVAGQGQNYVSQAIATNNASAASPAVAVTVAVPAAASFISASATQGACSEASGVVTCDFGQIEGNAGTATANVTLKAIGDAGQTINNTASVAKATPTLTASAATEITSPASCPAGYTEFSGHLDADKAFTSSPIQVTEAGQKYVDLTAPASFAFFAITNTRYGQHTYVYPHAKHGHRWGAAGTYQVGVQAGPDAGGDYTLCVNLNPAQ